MYWHDVIHDAVSMYKRDGRLAMSVGNTGFGEDGAAPLGARHPVLREALGDLRRLVLGDLRHHEAAPGPRARRRAAGDDLPPGRSPDGAGADRVAAAAAAAAPAEPALAALVPGVARRAHRLPRLRRRLPGGRGRPAAQPLALQPLRLSRRRAGCTAAWRCPASRPTRTTGPRSTCSSCATAASCAASTAAARAGPSTASIPLRGKPETVPADDIASRSSIRYVSFPPFPAVLMAPFVAIWGLAFNDVLFTALWAGAQPGAAVPAAAPPARARPVAAHAGRRPVADGDVRRRLGLLLLRGRRAGLVHAPTSSPSRCRSATSGRRWARGARAGRAVRGARLRDPPALAGVPAVRLRGGAGVGRLGRAADARRRRRALAQGDAAVRRCRSRPSGRSWRVLQLRPLRQPVRVRPQVPGRAVAGADLPLRPVQLPLPVAQPGRRAGAAAAHHDARAVREDQPARHEHAGHLAEPRLHGAAAGAAARCAGRSGSRSLRRRSRRCCTRTRATSSSATASASTTWSSSSCCWRSAAGP